MTRLLARIALGRRLPVTTGELTLPGLARPVTIRRDRWGVPHIDAECDADGWFGLGFCHAQDRGFQLESLLRFGRGTMAELVGPSGLAIDRLSRRIGFHRSAERQLSALDTTARNTLSAYVNGLNAGFAHGLTDKPHEFAVLGGEPTPWTTADVLAFLKVNTFLLPANWDVELARLRILRADGPDAVAALDPSDIVKWSAGALDHGPGQPSPEAPTSTFGLPAGGGGSNNWTISGARTQSGKPLLASDPHLAAIIPCPWYLAHVRTPEWAVAGATFVGGPGFPIGHNGHACWGVTAGLTDQADLFVETIGPDGRSVREADGSFSPCETIRETIVVKGQASVIEDVLVTPRGPVVSPLSPDLAPTTLSLRAVWLDPLPVRGFLETHKARDFDTFRQAFREWPLLPLNLLYADSGGTIGYQLVGQLPRRKSGHGLMPMPADQPDGGWNPDLVPFDEMPTAENPEVGFFATANDDPHTFAPTATFLGMDFVDPYRATVIREELSRQPNEWTVAGCLELQRNLRSKPWEELREIILGVRPTDNAAREAIDLLTYWNGHVTADSPGATIFELFLAECSSRVAKSKSPNSWLSVIGQTGLGAIGHNLFCDRRTVHAIRLLREQPDGWFTRSWPAEIESILASVIGFLRANHGPGSAWWEWGDVRPLLLRHTILGRVRGLKSIFNRGPYPIGGDANTVSQAGCRPSSPTSPTHNFANMRTVFDTADWSNCRFVLAGGQSGNPLSDHYDDQLQLWRRGEAIAIPWTGDEVVQSATAALRLTPEKSAS